MLGIIQKILNQYSNNRSINELTLQNLIESIVTDDKRFDCAYYFNVDLYNNEIFCDGVFPIEYQSLKHRINKEIRIASGNLKDDTYYDKMGLFRFVAKKFISGNVDECYIIIDEISEFIQNDKYARFYIDSIPKNEFICEYFFPVYIIDKNKKLLHSIVVLLSKNKSTVTKDDLVTLSTLLSQVLTWKESNSADTLLQKFINGLMDYNSFRDFDIEYDYIFKLLKEMYYEKKDKFQHTHLLYASMWSLNTNDPDNLFLEKEKNYNFKKLLHEKEQSPLIVSQLQNAKKHIFIEFIESLYISIKSQKTRKFSSKSYILGHVASGFENYDQFLSDNELDETNILVLIPIIPLNPNQSDADYIGMLALYFDQNTYSYYYHNKLLQTISHKIYENKKILIQTIRRNLRYELIRYSQVESFSVLNAFYKEAAKAIKLKLNCENCYIYLYDPSKSSLNLKSEQNNDNRNFPPVIPLNANELILFNYYVKYNDRIKEIIEYVNKLKNDNEYKKPLIYSNRKFLSTINVDSIYSYLIIPIKIINDPTQGILVCINNLKSINPSRNIIASFLYKDYDIALISAEIISFYTAIFSYSNRFEKLYSGFRHETGKLSSKIISYVQDIKPDTTFDELVLAKKLFRIELNARYLNIVANNLMPLPNGPQISKKNINIGEILRLLCLYEDILNDDCKGLTVINLVNHEVKINESIYIILLNLLNNSTDYSYIGTNVIVTIKQNKNTIQINISNMGIALPPDKDSILYGNRAEMANRRAIDGIGSGLSKVKEILNYLNGTIKIHDCQKISNRNIFIIEGLNDYIKFGYPNDEIIRTVEVKVLNDNYLQPNTITPGEGMILQRFFEYALVSLPRSRDVLNLYFRNIIYSNYIYFDEFIDKIHLNEINCPVHLTSIELNFPIFS